MEPNISSQPQTPEVKNPIEQPVSSTPANPSSKTKYILIAVLVLLVLFAVGGAYYLGIKNQSSQNNNQITVTIKPSPTLTPVPTIQPSPASTTDLTANWKTYTNSTYNFSLKYPPNLTVKEENDTQTFANCHNESVLHVYNNLKFTTGHMVQGYEDYWGFGVVVSPTNGRTIKEEYEGCQSMSSQMHVNISSVTNGADEAATIDNGGFIKVYRVKNQFFDLINFQNELPPPDSKDATPAIVRDQIISTFKFTQ